MKIEMKETGQKVFKIKKHIISDLEKVTKKF